MVARTYQITFAASDELADALEREAFRTDQSRAGAIRSVLADYLRDVGILRTTDPTTRHQGQTNRHFRTRGSR